MSTRLWSLLAVINLLLLNPLCAVDAFAIPLQAAAETSAVAAPATSQLAIFNARDGRKLDWNGFLAALEPADVIVVGEVHTDAKGHAIQQLLIVAAARRWPGLIVSVEEFDRSQQGALDAYFAGEKTGMELKALRAFVNPLVKKHWEDWYLPKLRVARQGGVTLLASNAPLKYSRLVRNVGCDNLPVMEPAERSLFDCPAAAIDPEYRERFFRTMSAVSRTQKHAELKPLKAEQLERMFRAQQVWDATMAQSIVWALENSSKGSSEGSSAGEAGKVLHLVGFFHSDFDGGLIRELGHRSPASKLLSVSLRPGNSEQLQNNDRGRTDIVIYTGRYVRH